MLAHKTCSTNSTLHGTVKEISSRQSCSFFFNHIRKTWPFHRGAKQLFIANCFHASPPVIFNHEKTLIGKKCTQLV